MKCAVISLFSVITASWGGVNLISTTIPVWRVCPRTHFVSPGRAEPVRRLGEQGTGHPSPTPWYPLPRDAPKGAGLRLPRSGTATPVGTRGQGRYSGGAGRGTGTSRQRKAEYLQGWAAESRRGQERAETGRRGQKWAGQDTTHRREQERAGRTGAGRIGRDGKIGQELLQQRERAGEGRNWQRIAGEGRGEQGRAGEDRNKQQQVKQAEAVRGGQEHAGEKDRMGDQEGAREDRRGQGRAEIGKGGQGKAGEDSGE